VPADPSSPIPAALTQLAHAQLLHDGEPPRLLAYQASVPDPRAARGRRHPLVAILGLAAAAVLAGARSIAAIAEWAAEFLVTGKQAHDLLVVKGNQPTLLDRCARLPWHRVPVADRTRDRGHGRATPPRPRPTPTPRDPGNQPRMNPTSPQNDGALP
jgi:hypothetical protein